MDFLARFRVFISILSVLLELPVALGLQFFLICFIRLPF